VGSLTVAAVDAVVAAAAVVDVGVAVVAVVVVAEAAGAPERSACPPHPATEAVNNSKARSGQVRRRVRSAHRARFDSSMALPLQSSVRLMS
jgi:hypothetical protein